MATDTVVRPELGPTHRVFGEHRDLFFGEDDGVRPFLICSATDEDQRRDRQAKGDRPEACRGLYAKRIHCVYLSVV